MNKTTDDVRYTHITQLNEHIHKLTTGLHEKVRAKALEYVSLRQASTWTDAQLDEVLLLARYEYTTQMMSETLDSFSPDEMRTDAGQKRFMVLSRALNTSLRDIGILKGALGLTVSMIFGDKRALASSNTREMKIREIAPTGSVSNIESARQNAKRMLA
jgi:hypothetical protein